MCQRAPSVFDTKRRDVVTLQNRREWRRSEMKETRFLPRSPSVLNLFRQPPPAQPLLCHHMKPRLFVSTLDRNHILRPSGSIIIILHSFVSLFVFFNSFSTCYRCVVQPISVLCSSLCCVALPISFNDSSPSNAQCLLYSFSFCLNFFFLYKES